MLQLTRRRRNEELWLVDGCTRHAVVGSDDGSRIGRSTRIECPRGDDDDDGYNNYNHVRKLIPDMIRTKYYLLPHLLKWSPAGEMTGQQSIPQYHRCLGELQ